MVKLNFPFSYFEERKKQNDFAKKHPQQEIYKNIIKKETVFQKEEIDKIVKKYVADKHHRDQILSQERYLITSEIASDQDFTDNIRRIVLDLLEELQIIK
jgi:hypothetical protein